MNPSHKDELLLLSLIDGSIAEKDFHEVTQRLKMEPELLALYRRSCEFETTLGELFPTLHATVQGLADKQEFIPISRSRNWWPAFAAAAAITIIAVVLGLQTFQSETRDAVVSLDFSPSSIIGGSSDVPFPKTMERGRPLKILHGHVGLSFDGGKANAVIESPAEFTLSTENEILVKTGKVFISVTDGAKPLSCKVGEYLIEDLGTVFGFEAKDNELGELLVDEGKVRVSIPSQNLIPPAIVLPGNGITATSAGFKAVEDPDFTTFRRKVAHDQAFFTWSTVMDPELKDFTRTTGGTLSADKSAILTPDLDPAYSWIDLPSFPPTKSTPNYSISIEMDTPSFENVAVDNQVGISIFNGTKERLFLGKIQGKTEPWSITVYSESGEVATREIFALEVWESNVAFRIHFNQDDLSLDVHARTSAGWNKVFTKSLGYIADFDRFRLMAHRAELRLKKIEVFSEK